MDEEEEIHPIEAQVTEFFGDMMEEVDNGEKAGVMMESLILAISAFITLKFEPEGLHEIVNRFCLDLKETLQFSDVVLDHLAEENEKPAGRRAH